MIAMYIIWVTPVRVGFDLPAQGTWFWVEGLIDIFFYTDLVMNFFTAYEVGGWGRWGRGLAQLEGRGRGRGRSLAQLEGRGWAWRGWRAGAGAWCSWRAGAGPGAAAVGPPARPPGQHTPAPPAADRLRRPIAAAAAARAGKEHAQAQARAQSADPAARRAACPRAAGLERRAGDRPQAHRQALPAHLVHSRLPGHLPGGVHRGFRSLPPGCLPSAARARRQPTRPGAPSQVRALEGTWGCSARGNCHDALIGDTNVDFLRILKALRVFRILWILKHFKRIRLTHMLGRLQVRRRALPGCDAPVHPAGLSEPPG
jgi:hypothetical protein